VLVQYRNIYVVTIDCVLWWYGGLCETTGFVGSNPHGCICTKQTENYILWWVV